MSSDNIYQGFKLYIEGVQVPFISITINQGLGQLPTASVMIPPQSGLMDIARFYQPKIHIFFTERARIDANTGKVVPETDKVLFTGLIRSVNYSKSRDQSGSIAILYECVHRYSLISECLLDYSGQIRSDKGIQGTDGALIPTSFNAPAAIQEAMEGWTSISSSTDTDYPALSATESSPTNFLPSGWKKFAKRLTGMPGILLNFWNQLNRAAFLPELSKFQGVFTYIYKPLIEDGLDFFSRLSGHYYIENLINTNSRAPSCVNNSTKDILIPPCNQIFMMGTVRGDITLQTLGSFLTNSNELTNIYQIFQSYLTTLDYDWLTLACPAEVSMDPDSVSQLVYTGTGPSGGTYAVDTIVKPGMPFFYSPACNILYPSMYTSVQVTYDESNLPTRIDVMNNQASIEGQPPMHFRAPSSVRYGIALRQNKGNQNLENTLFTSYGAIGRYEMGRGIKLEYLEMPNWLGRLTTSNNSGTDTSKAPEEGSYDANAIKALQGAWNKRYSGDPTDPSAMTLPSSMNPFSPDSKINPGERVLFSTADYYYTRKFASIKSGSASCLFNPYIIPGYPMDILEANPNLPSFHAMCMSVTHTITSSSVSTGVSFGAAMTYTELANYYIPFLNPYLQVSFGLTDNPSLVGNANNPAVISAATKYYQTLGSTPVFPEVVYDFTNGTTKSVKMSKAGLIPNDGVALGRHSFEDDLMGLCYRPIESKDAFAARFNLSYIDMVPQNYTSTGVKYGDPVLSTSDISSKFEIGQSQFLDYSNGVYGAINGAQ